MAINLQDIPNAVKAYLNTKVTVTSIDIFAATESGDVINPNERINIKIRVKNADAANGGVALKNVKYRLSVDSPAVAKLEVPKTTAGKTTDLAGNVLTQGLFVNSMIFDPIESQFELPVGDTQDLTLAGQTGATAGTTILRVRVIADVDVDALFPKNEDSTPAAKTFTVVNIND
jgi:hypothetical protein